MKNIACLFLFESDSSPGKTYQTLLYDDSSTSCDCKGWTFKRRNVIGGGRTCKHTRLVEAGIAEQHAVKVQDYRKAQPKRSFVTERIVATGDITNRVSRKLCLED